MNSGCCKIEIEAANELNRSASEKYFVPVTAKTLDVLEAFHSAEEELTLKEVIERTGIPHTTAFRILFTLARRGYLAQREKKYRLMQVRQKLKVGYAALSERVAISVAIAKSLKEAVAEAAAELVLLNNDESPRLAIETARRLVEARVDVAIEFQNDVQVAPVIADIFATARVPTIAVHIPQPGAVYFGPDNYRAGWTAGVALANHAATHWRRRFDLLLLLDIPKGGPTLQSRMTGVLGGLEHILGPVPRGKVVRMDGAGNREVSREVTLSAIRRRRSARMILASATSDESALGAFDALCELGLAETSAVIGHDGTQEAFALIASNRSSFIGTVAFFPERYGHGLMQVVRRLLRGEQVPPAVYVQHELVWHSNVRRFLMVVGRGDHP